METIILPEQDIVNAICLYHARKKYVLPEDVEVELFYDDSEGFSAEANVNGQQAVFMTADIVSALRLWLDEYVNIDPMAAAIQLLFNEEDGIYASVR